MKKGFIYFTLFLFCLGFFECCAMRQQIKNLSPEKKEFLSKVRYIITGQERKIFLNLPKSERDEFIKEFWEKRDPDPSTEENEFKEEYFSRIEEANNLFREGGTPGWLQDRGRVYILLGPPFERHTYPRGRSFYGKPEEVWYYGFYPIIFVDTDWNGDYELTPLGAQHLSQINKAQMDEKPSVKRQDVVFDFKAKILKAEQGEVVFQIKIPYKDIWFEEQDGIWQTTLSVFLEVFNDSKEKTWEKKTDYPLSFSEESLDDKFREDYLIQIPATLDPGRYTVKIDIVNMEDNNRISRTLKFKVK
ncbi:MAG: GWxTD domain-containing protein [Candidatus Aminicenantes bacterium]